MHMLEFHRISDLLECHRTQRGPLKFSKNIAPPKFQKSLNFQSSRNLKDKIHRPMKFQKAQKKSMHFDMSGDSGISGGDVVGNPRISLWVRWHPNFVGLFRFHKNHANSWTSWNGRGGNRGESRNVCTCWSFTNFRFFFEVPSNPKGTLESVFKIQRILKTRIIAPPRFQKS